MGKIYKPHQIKIDSQKPIFIDHRQKIAKPEEDLEPSEDAFAVETFRALSPEHLAGSGEKITTKKAPEKGDQTTPPAKPEAEKTSHEPVSFLSPAAKKSRHAAALEAIKIKELELEALEEELRNWEEELKGKESKLTSQEQDFSQNMLKKRHDADSDANQSVKTARETAATIVETAKAEAEAIKKSARLEVDSVRDKAYKEGFALGEEKGIAAGEKQGLHEAGLDWQNLMQESEALINELQTSRMGILKASEEEMLKLVIAFARTVIKVEPIAQPEIVLKNIDQALNRVSEVDKVVLRINIRDKSMCQAHKEQFMARLGSVSELRIIEDPTLSPGGIKIETGVGTIDATIESQARELERALLNKFRKSQANT
ncbi:MAG TPA: hypothetical protein DCG57_17130 [Candidatus Riflebacteria bacterium]|nr:hypothetical protein [Candidatus Riflebacteria bacterium]